MAIESMYVFTGDEVVATDLPAKLNENFAKTETNMLKTVNNVAQDENHNINVTELIPKQITSNTNLNNLVTSGEYTFTKGSATITNSPTPNSFFLTVLRNNALVKQVVTEVVLDDPITYTRVLSGSSWSPWVEGGKVKTINSIKPDDSGNVDLSSMDYAVRSEIGIWKPSESVSVGDVRYLNGRENAGIVLECIEAGTTGSEQPTISENTDNIIANFTSNDRIGHMRLIFNLAEKDADEIIALGIAYNRTTYPELWEYVQSRPDLLLTETEWQAKYAETNGKFVPYYSSGNGTSTFRTPLLSAYIKGADSTNSLGSYLSAGLPNITGKITPVSTQRSGTSANDMGVSSAGAITASYYDNSGGSGSSGTGRVTLNIDASLSNPIYGNSTTVTPETMQGIWVIKAFGVVTNNGNTDLNDVLNGVTELETNKLSTSGGTMTGSIIFDTPTQTNIKNSNDENAFHIYGGSNATNGAVLALYGQNLVAETISESAVGGFALQTKKITGDDDGLNYYTLIGSPNGILSWKQKPVETVYYDNGNLIRYSNGLQIICGSFSYVNSDTYIIFPLPFVNASYKIVPISINNNGFPIIVSTQATQFRILARPAGASTGELASGSYFEYIAIGRWK